MIHTQRFYLRELQVNDVTDRYVNWLKDKTIRQYIEARFDLNQLKQYVKEKTLKKDVLFLGIFDKSSGEHVGNIKYEPVNPDLGFAVMGILIGQPEWRGKGVAAEVIKASAELLVNTRQIKKIILGVDRRNTMAINAYVKIGFTEQHTEFIRDISVNGMTMVWDLT
jgi:RimJ/RimL family protein N-acetyltransferase